MGLVHHHGVESSAAVMHHPIHPMLIAFPVATLIGTAITDVVFLNTGTPFWSVSSWWLLSAGIVSGLAAAVPGAVDYFTIPSVRKLPSANVHAIGNIVAIMLSALNLWLRDRDGSSVTLVELALSIVVVILLGITAWLGGELSYRYRIGIIADESTATSEKMVGR